MLDIKNIDHQKLIVYALHHLNLNYGRGEICLIDFEIRSVYVKKQFGFELPFFRLVGNTIHFRGHQKTIKLTDMQDPEIMRFADLYFQIIEENKLKKELFS